MPKFPIDQDLIIQQVNQERDLWYNFVDTKRKLFLDRLRLYNNLQDTDNKIYVRLIRSVMQSLMALYYTDSITVNFTGRQLGDDDVAEKWNNLAEFDQEEMKLPQINYDAQWNRLFYWVGIRVFDYWDDFKKVPVFKSVDPLTWIPDPLGYMWSARFHWFELEVADGDLTDDIYFNVVDILPNTSRDEDDRREVTDEIRQFNHSEAQTNDQPIYSIYNHYTTIKGKKYLVTLANDRSLIIRFEEITAVYEEEKANPREIEFPVILNYYEPFKGDPFGISIPDILEDKQKAEQLFLNLNRIKAENEAWGDMFTVDTDAILNMNDLKQHTLWPKFIRANTKINPNPIREVPKSAIKSDSYQLPQLIRQQSTSDLWLDERAIGGSGDKSITATENQRIQQNQNIKLVLWNTINQWGEKDFWRLRKRVYFEFFDFKDEKSIKLQNEFGSVITTIKRADISTGYDIDVKIINKSQQAEIKEKEKAGYLVIASLVLEDPSAPTISKTFAKRQLAKVNGIDREQVQILFPASIEEEDAKANLDLLNNDLIDEIPDIEDLQEDHLTYLVVYNKAMDTEAKRIAMDKRRQAYIASGQSKPKPQEWANGIAGISAQATNAALQAEQTQWAASLADVTTQ